MPNAEPAAMEADVQRARQDSINRAAPGYVVDSILPLAEQLRRFREGLPRVEALRGGASGRDALLRAIADGIARADTGALRALTITRAEYAWLVYPSSPFAHPPMQQAPQVSWLLETTASDAGFARLLARHGGKPLAATAFRCPDDATREGDNLILAGCVVARNDGARSDGARSDGARTEAQRLFGALIARDGQWKVLSWANSY